jgi:hypothetical protein
MTFIPFVGITYNPRGIMLALERTPVESVEREEYVLPKTPQYPPPFVRKHYNKLPGTHKEQLVFTHLPHLRKKFNGTVESIQSLPREQRFNIYEKMMLGEPVDVMEERALLESRVEVKRKIALSKEKELKTVLSLVKKNSKIRAEDLLGELSPKTFTRLMLYVKYAGDNQKSILRFLGKELKR